MSAPPNRHGLRAAGTLCRASESTHSAFLILFIAYRGAPTPTIRLCVAEPRQERYTAPQRCGFSLDFILFGRFEDSASKIIKFYLVSNENYAIIPSMTEPYIVRQTVIINDDYIRKNRRAEDGHIILKFAQAIHDKNQIILYNNIINKNITLATSAEIKE